MPTAMITGANRGLGLEFARQYFAAGWQVIAACRTPANATPLQELAGAGSGMRIVRIDVSDHETIAAAAAEIGDQPIDVLINNAGSFGPRVGADNDWRQSFGHIDYDIWRDVLDVNTLGPVRIAETFVTNVAASEQKKIITVSSQLGSIGDVGSEGMFAYRTSKAAVNMAMKALAQQLSSQNIIVALYCPGWCRTDMGGNDAPLEPAESVANMRELIARLTIEDSGTFTHHSGDRLPW